MKRCNLAMDGALVALPGAALTSIGDLGLGAAGGLVGALTVVRSHTLWFDQNVGGHVDR
jgi:hypothetical protein